MGNPAFELYVGIDYSGAQTPNDSLKGLRVYTAEPASAPREVHPPPSPRRYWTRREIAEWLRGLLAREKRALVGIDHGFSFPMRYFVEHHVRLNWPAFLEDFVLHWPTGENYMSVDFVRDGFHGNGPARTGDARWRRLTDVRARAKSVFQFDVQGTVAKSTHAGIPWLLYLRKHAARTRPIHFWPFDGWRVPQGRSVVAEVYPKLWSANYPRENRDPHQHDAYSIAAWMRQTDADGSLEDYFDPGLSGFDRITAGVEGWILGVMADPSSHEIPQMLIT
ncbi:MAG TPA: hypothetical protein VG168_04465 [Bryobacteraceae bacterium]|nr:hypothetical protein [Bryobacteraceae bacterium]